MRRMQTWSHQRDRPRRRHSPSHDHRPGVPLSPELGHLQPRGPGPVRGSASYVERASGGPELWPNTSPITKQGHFRRPPSRRSRLPMPTRSSHAAAVAPIGVEHQPVSKLPPNARPSSMTAPATRESGVWAGRMRDFRALGDCRRLLRDARGSRRAGLGGGRRRCRFTPIRIMSASLPLFAETGSQIQSAEMAMDQQ